MPRRAIISWTLGVLAGLLLPLSPLRAAPHKPIPPQAFVKVNLLYLLYTYPVVPYLNKKGVLMVGLEGMGRGLFDKAPAGDAQAKAYDGDDYGRVTVDAVARRETLTLGVHAVTFTADAATARADGADVLLEAPAHWDAAARAMVVPAQGLARCLGLDAKWDPTHHVLLVTAPERMTRDDAHFPAEHFSTLDTTDVVPDRVTFYPNNAPRGVDGVNGVATNTDRRKMPWLMIEMKNTADVVLIGGCDLNMLILYSGAGTSPDLGEGPYANSPDSNQITDGAERRRYPLAMQTLDGLIPLCVVSCPATAAFFSRSHTLQNGESNTQ